MLSIDEAQQLMEKLIEFRSIAQDTKAAKDISIFRKQEKLCVEKFSYLVTMKTGKYKTFSNYEDLNQEGFEALLKGMKNYNPKKGNAFWWFHKYIDTRIARSANLHTTIRYPLKVAKEIPPHKESTMPLMIEDIHIPEKELENSQINYNIQKALSALTNDQRNIISLAYGFDDEKPMSVNKICKKLNISRSSCIKNINSALSLMKESIKL